MQFPLFFSTSPANAQDHVHSRPFLQTGEQENERKRSSREPKKQREVISILQSLSASGLEALKSQHLINCFSTRTTLRALCFFSNPYLQRLASHTESRQRPEKKKKKRRDRKSASFFFSYASLREPRG